MRQYTPLIPPSNWNEKEKAFVNQLTSLLDNVHSKISGSWMDWTPTLTWTTATPGSITKTARYCIIGKTLFFNVTVNSTDGNNATGLTVSLPVAPKENCLALAVQGVGTTWTNLLCYVDTSGPKLSFRSGSVQTCTNAVACYFRITGQYEI